MEEWTLPGLSGEVECIVQDPRMGQELGTGPRVGRMFPVDNLHLPPVAPVSVAATVSLALWHSRLGHAPSSRVQQLASRGLCLKTLLIVLHVS